MNQKALSSFLNGFAVVAVLSLFLWRLASNNWELDAEADQIGFIHFSNYFSSSTASLLSWLLFLWTLFYISTLLQKHKLPEHRGLNYFAFAILFLLFIGNQWIALETALGVFLLFIGFRQLLKIHQQASVAMPLFLSGLCFGGASLVAFQLLLFTFIPFIALSFFRPFKLKEHLILLVALSLPWYYFVGISYLFDQSVVWPNWQISLPPFQTLSTTWFHTASAAIASIIALLSVFSALGVQSKLVVRSRNQLNVIFTFLGLSLLQAFLFWSNPLSLLLLTAAFSFFYPWFLQSAKRPWLVQLSILIAVLLEITAEILG
ncbi:MAG: hypothetical protein RIC95_14395 [Vicingaceae bacterium]